MSETSSSTTALVGYEPALTEAEQLTLVGFLTGYRGQTRDAYTLDLRQFTSWCLQHGRHLFEARRVDIEWFARDLEERGRAKATVARRLCTVRGFYRYAEEEGVTDRSPAIPRSAGGGAQGGTRSSTPTLSGRATT